MTTLTTTLVLSTLGIALFATPVFARTPDRQPPQTAQIVGQYRNGGQMTGRGSDQFDRDSGEYARQLDNH